MLNSTHHRKCRSSHAETHFTLVRMAVRGGERERRREREKERERRRERGRKGEI